VLTMLIGLYVLKESFEILRRTTHILMEGAPLNISPDDIKVVLEDKFDVKMFIIYISGLSEKKIFFLKCMWN